jgi:hypothetical protein
MFHSVSSKLTMLPCCAEVWQLCYICIDVAEAGPDRGTSQPAGVKAERTVSGW